MTIEQKLKTFRFATVKDFRVGLNFEEVQPCNEGKKKHRFVPHEIKAEQFLSEAHEFFVLCSDLRALVRIDGEKPLDVKGISKEIEESEEYKKLITQI